MAGLNVDWGEAVGAALTVAGAALAFHSKWNRTRKEAAKEERKQEFHDAFVLALNNGAGEIVSGIVERAIARALDGHTLACPVRPLVDQMEERVLTLERR